MVIEKKYKPDEEPDPEPFLFVTLEQKRIDQTKPFDPKTAIWAPDEKELYAQAKILSVDGDITKVQMPSFEEKELKKNQLQLVNPPKYEKCEDMSNLTHLNDASVLHNLKQRYYHKLIYTYSGLFCVAINPYKRYPIYTNRAIAIYKGRRRNEVPPHIFALSDGAYTDMMSNGTNQSILITGESGAGKTENTKKVITYFANVGATTKKKDEGQKQTNLEDQVVQTNPVLEAFGNAKTTRNDNSSRFGKFIRIHFGPMGKLAGADIETYLLEKARVISQGSLERSYHIFYQMMSGAVKGLTDRCHLSTNICDYHYVSQGKTTIANVDDNEEMEATDTAFDVLNFSQEEKNDIYSIVASVMISGGMKFKQKGREEQAEADGTAEGEKIGKLLGVDGQELYKNLLKPRIKVGNEFVTQGRNKVQVSYSVGALAKGMYDRLFKWLVKKVNMTLDTKQKRASFIGVLDIFGFEIFDFNGFEQLCINFTNEKLQQFFNHHMFVLEQEEYKREEIDWVFMDFGMDLQACIDLMEKPMGVLSILEEESMFPKATDKSFEDKLKTNHLGKSALFQKPKPPKAGQSEAHFAIAHYAGMVAYNLTGWLEKNKDPLNDTVVDQFKKGKNKLLIEIFADHPGQSAPADAGGGKGGRGKKGGGFATVSASYREQLAGLMKTLNATTPHFIRCIIPNETKSPGVIDSRLVMHQLTCNGVLEGIRICRQGFPSRMVYHDFRHRYKILAVKEIETAADDRTGCGKCLEKIQMDADKYRLGNTKVFFRAGVLGDLEEIRDDTLNRIFAQVQAYIRGYQSQKMFKKLQEQRAMLLKIQRSIRNFMRMQGWLWFRLWMRVRPMIYETRIEDEIKALEDEAKAAEEALQQVLVKRKEAEKANAALLQEKTEMLAKLEKERGSMGDVHVKQEKMRAQRDDLQVQLNETQERLEAEEAARQELATEKRRVEQEVGGLRKDYEDLEVAAKKLDAEKTTRDHQIRSINDQITSQDEIINKLNREKKRFQEQQQKTADDFGSQEDKVTHLGKVKQKLEQTLDELEDSLEREKKTRSDADKSKRKVEGDLKLTQEAVVDLEKAKRQLEQTIQRKDREQAQLAVKLEEEQVTVTRLQRGIKELQARIEELEEELEAERQARAKAEKQRADLARELEELGERLDEAGGATSAQVELNRKREAEIGRMRRDVEEQNIQQESSMAGLRRKHNEVLQELSEQIDQIGKAKAKIEKERQSYASEAHDMRMAIERVSNDKAAEEKQARSMQDQLAALTGRLDEATRTVADLDNNKKKMTADNTDLLRQVEEAESQLSQLQKVKSSLQSQLEETTRQCDEETRERAVVLGKYRNIEHDIDSMREQLDEELDHKSDLSRQVAKGAAEAQMWRNKFEQEGVARAEELDEQRRKIAARLQEAAEQLEAVNQKNVALEKFRTRITGEMDEMHVEVERAQALAAQMEKKAKGFDKIIADWKNKVDDVAAELDGSQRECRNYSTELFRVRSAYDESLEQLDAVRRENKNLADEVKDLMDQISDGGRSLSEIDKARYRLDQEKNELQAALEEAESALEQEENKVLRGQLELNQARQDIERRIQEREEDFENTRRNYQRQMESMQASLESEARGRSEALRLKKKLETDIGELEVAVERANVDTLESQRVIKRLQDEVREIQTHVVEEERLRVESREMLVLAEKRANGLHGELEESRTLLEQADRGRRLAETELGEVQQQLVEVGGNLSSVHMLQRRLEDEVKTLHVDLDEMLNEARNSEEKAKRAMLDAARLADELRSEQDNGQTQEQARKQLELQVKDLQTRLDEAEANAIKNGRKILAKLEERLRSMEAELDHEQRRHGEASKNLRKADRRIKELFFQGDEDKKNQQRLHDLIDALQQKMKTYKRQIEEAEEIAALNLAKYRKCQQELEGAEERCDMAETTLSKFRARGRGVSAIRAFSPTK